MDLLLEKRARRGLERMPRKAALVMLNRLANIAANPRTHHANVKPLTGFKDTFRLRQGDWRAAYRLLHDANQMRVVVVDVRGNVYR
jgi:mRNA-degrading endonuclease RelE of RelBE toxin-antitoxin system